MKQSVSNADIIASTDMNVVNEVEQQYYEVLKVLVDPELEGLKNRIQALYNNLAQHLEEEESLVKQCKINKGEIESYQQRRANCNKVVEEEIQRGDNIKKSLEKMEGETEELKRRENDIRETLKAHQVQLNLYDKESIKGLEEIEIRQENEENELKKKFEQQQKIKEELMTKLLSLQNQQQYSNEEIGHVTQKKNEAIERIDLLRQVIKEIEIRNEREKRNDEQKKEQLNQAKNQKDASRSERELLQHSIKELDIEIAETAQSLKAAKKEREEMQRVKAKLLKLRDQALKDYDRKNEEKEKLESVLDIRAEERSASEHRLIDLVKEKEQTEEELKFANSKLREAKVRSEESINNKNRLMNTRQIEAQALDKLKLLKDKNKGKLKQLLQVRLERDKKSKTAANKEHQTNLQNVEERNKLKKIENEVESYKIEEEKLGNILEQIKREQEKYGIEASHAHSKYYQTLEELKIKNTQIQNLQKENQEVEKKSKHQQNLYQAVRSDRNLFSKDFIKSKEEISELRKKYKRMTYAVDQLREEIKSKDQELVELDKEFKKVEAENIKIEADNNRAQQQIKSTEEVIRNQENHTGHLKKIIQEAKNQKAKQQKDYDMVRNERDILGTQLIKRNHELAELYEKIKLSNSNLTKGQIYYKERQKEFNEHKIRLATLRNQFLSIDDKIRSIDDLKAEISYKEKELLNHQAKVKALEDELKNPMNVHRWRKLEATDQENYERILKIQTLQRRLIAKTEEVEAKENLIRDKEKLFLELKNILARQPGSEIHQQLVKYKEALKEKTGQMKKMKKELEDAHKEMGISQFETDRLKTELRKMKQEYFDIREASEKQLVEDRNFGRELMDLGSNNDKMFELNLRK